MEYRTISNLFKLAVFLNIFVFVNCLGKIQYDNYRIFSVLVENEDQLKFLKENEAFSDEYQFIDAQFAVNKKIRVVVPPHKFAEFDELIKNLEIETILVVSNLQEIIEEEKKYNTRRSNNLDWTRYWKLDEIHSWLKQLASKYPNDVELINVGKSYEEREILGIKLNKRKELGKKQIVFEGTMHAREWISAATVTWMLNELITSKDPLINKLAETYEWNIIPVVNVDGYEFSWTNDRLWRKTRKPSVDGCFGTDPNRNFDIFHNLSIPYPCDQTYPGAHPFSELETKQYSEFLKSLDKFVAFFSFHSYSQLLMFPYGYKEDHPNNYDVLYAISKKAVKALSVRFGTKYKVGTIEKCLGKTAGSSIDWVQDKLNPNLTYVYELRDTGTNGFELPASQIIDNSLEVFDSLVTILNEAQMRGIA